MTRWIASFALVLAAGCTEGGTATSSDRQRPLPGGVAEQVEVCGALFACVAATGVAETDAELDRALAEVSACLSRPGALCVAVCAGALALAADGGDPACAVGE